MCAAEAEMPRCWMVTAVRFEDQDKHWIANLASVKTGPETPPVTRVVRFPEPKPVILGEELVLTENKQGREVFGRVRKA